MISKRTQEEIIGVWGRATDSKYLDQVVKLTVYVSDDGDWGCYMDHIALPHQNLLGLLAYLS